MSDCYERSTIVHEHLRGKIGVFNKVPIESQDDLSIAYTPGVAGPCLKIAEDGALARELTIKRNAVAVVTDGSAVLGLGNIGPLAALPVMEGKALLFKEYANIDAWPICLDTQDADEIGETVRRIAPVFGGINLEDIAAPRCFEVEARLQDLGIPVFHDDQHGTAIVLLAALINACRVLGRDPAKLRVVISGAGAAGTAIAQLLRGVNFADADWEPVEDIVVCDSRGTVARKRSAIGLYQPGRAYRQRARGAGGGGCLYWGQQGRFARCRRYPAHGRGPDHPGNGQSRARDHARCRAGRRCGDRRHRAQRFSQSGQQCLGLSRHLPRRA